MVWGMRSAMYYYPEDKIGIIILTNLRGANPERIIEQLAGFYIPDLNPYLGAGLSPEQKLLHSDLLKITIQRPWKRIRNFS